MRKWVVKLLAQGSRQVTKMSEVVGESNEQNLVEGSFL